MTTHLINTARISLDRKLVECEAGVARQLDWSLEPELVDCEKCREVYRKRWLRYEPVKRRPSWAKG